MVESLPAATEATACVADVGYLLACQLLALGRAGIGTHVCPPMLHVNMAGRSNKKKCRNQKSKEKVKLVASRWR